MAGGHPNLYLYCLNNPVHIADPTGTAPEWLHGVLDIAGCVPAIGELADLTNAVLYLTEGDPLNAGISAASVIPGVGDTAKGGRIIARAAKLVARGGVAVDLRRILPYKEWVKEMKKISNRGAYEIHHLIEKRFARELELDQNEIPSVPLECSEHRKITNRWREQQPYRKKGDQGPYGVTAEKILDWARKIYADHPEWVEQIEKFLRERGKLR
ncbi:MAG: hypothetical protein KatS3mg022_2036 [Armatimonadota bacterium]|nr:MAG: hypothetical protein KatS3mg022_2036 [Armatimonadota bacterium]